MEANISLKPDTLVNDRGGHGFTITIPGFEGNPQMKDPEQIFIEIIDGQLKIHVWHGLEDPTTLVCNRLKQ